MTVGEADHQARGGWEIRPWLNQLQYGDHRFGIPCRNPDCRSVAANAPSLTAAERGFSRVFRSAVRRVHVGAAVG